jgi:hypothetical protein
MPSHPSTVAAGAQSSHSELTRPWLLVSRIADLDTALMIVAAGISSRADTATIGRAAAVAALVERLGAEAAALLAQADAAIDRAPEGRARFADLTRVAHAAADLRIRLARVRTRLAEYRARARTVGRGRRAGLAGEVRPVARPTPSYFAGSPPAYSHDGPVAAAPVRRRIP